MINLLNCHNLLLAPELEIKFSNLSKTRYANLVNKKRKFIFFNIEDKVMLRNNTATNIEFRWIGPWLVTERTSWVDYKIQLVEDFKIRQTANIEHLKLYYSREERFTENQEPHRFNDFYSEDHIPDSIESTDRGNIFEVSEISKNDQTSQNN